MRFSSENSLLSAVVFLFFASSLSGCSLLIGNVKPVAEKSEGYEYKDLSKDSKEWLVLTSAVQTSPSSAASVDGSLSPDDEEENANNASDIAFQSRKTGAVISLNSSCRPSQADPEKPEDSTLSKFTEELFFGLSNPVDRQSRKVTVAGQNALETTAQGELNREPVKIQAIVLRFKSCLYDMMYISRPGNFGKNLGDFNSFVQGFKLK